MQVIDREGLRPTPDRIRETLFNWLSMDVAGATVLDCFAGAGGLGFEAASRGANQVHLVEKQRAVAEQLRANSQRLEAQNIEVNTQDVLKYLDRCTLKFDIVFIDPPYKLPTLRTQVIEQLLDLSLLNDGCKLYLEWPVGEEIALQSPALQWLKQKTAGQVVYAIAEWRDTG